MEKLKDIFFLKELLFSLNSFVGVNTITFVLFKIAAHIVCTERLYYNQEYSDHEGAINAIKNGERDEYNYKYKYSPTEKIGKKFKDSGIIGGIIYILFEFIPDIFYSTLFPEARFFRKYDIIFIIDILLLLVLRYFLFVIPGYSIFYVDILLFSYMLSTAIMLFGVIMLPHEREQIFNHYLIFITTTSFVFFFILFFAFYSSTVQTINAQAGWMLRYLLILTPFGYLVTHAKLIFTAFSVNDKTNVNRETRAVMGKTED